MCHKIQPIEKALPAEAEEIHAAVQATIRAVYPRYYPAAVVDFFCALHSVEQISEDIRAERVYVVRDGKKIVATGTVRENHITRVFVLPEFQGCGIGSSLFDFFERILFENYDTVQIDASLPAACLYEKHGYRTVTHGTEHCADGAVLIWEIMEKRK